MRLPVNTVIHTTLVGLEPATSRSLVRRATSMELTWGERLTMLVMVGVGTEVIAVVLVFIQSWRREWLNVANRMKPSRSTFFLHRLFTKSVVFESWSWGDRMCCENCVHVTGNCSKDRNLSPAFVDNCWIAMNVLQKHRCHLVRFHRSYDTTFVACGYIGYTAMLLPRDPTQSAVLL